MSNSITEKNLTPDEVSKLKTTMAAMVVNLQHIDDVREQYNELAKEVSDELEIKPADLKAAAQALHKQNVAAKRAKQDSIEEILTTLGYEIDDEDIG